MIRKALEEMQKEQNRDTKNIESLFEEFKGTYSKQMELLRKKKLDQSIFDEQLMTIQQFGSQLQHSVVLLHESIALHQFKADETKQGKNTKVSQLLEQIQSLQSWVMNVSKIGDADNQPTLS